MQRDSQDRLLVFLVALLCFILYFNSLGNTLVFDDLHTIQDNVYIKDARYIPLFFKGYYTSVSDVPKGMFRPILLLTFAFNYLFSRLNPLGYHIINILLHFLNGVLLYSLIRFLKKDLNFGLAIFICLLFIVHPINTETVTYISCRSDLLVTFLILCAFLSYAYSRFPLPALLYILALLTKETGLVLPFLVFAYDFMRPSAPDYTPAYRQAGISKGITQIKHRHIFYIVLIGISISYWIYRGIIFGSRGSILAPLSSPIRSFWSNILTQAAVTIFYLRLFFWPYPLSIHHTFPEPNSLFNPLAFFSVLVITIIIILIFVLRKKYPIVSLGLAWHLICLIPKFYATLNVVAAEHHFYLPSIGVYFILLVLLQRAFLKFRRQFMYIGVCIISIFTILVWFRNYEWKNTFSLWKSAVKVSPHSPIALNNLGIEYIKKEQYSQAEKYIRRAMSLTNEIYTQVYARVNLAHMRIKQGRLNEAEAILKEALKINPKDHHIYQSLGAIYIGMGEEEKAEEIWKKGLSFYPQSADITVNLGLLYLKQEKFSEARIFFQIAIEFNPDSYLAYFGLGQVLEEEPDVEGAIRNYQKAIRLNPGHTFSHYALGTLYAQKADSRALRHLKEVVKLDPNFAEAHNNLAVLYASMEPPQLELARQHAQKAKALGYKVEEEFLKIIK